MTTDFTNRQNHFSSIAPIMGQMMIEQIEREKKLKRFLLSLGETGEIADKVSDLILFHNRVKENAEKRYM